MQSWGPRRALLACPATPLTPALLAPLPPPSPARPQEDAKRYALLGAMFANSKAQGVHVLHVTSASTLCASLVAAACPPLKNAPRIEVLAARGDPRALHGLKFYVRTQERPQARGAQLATYARDIPQAAGAQAQLAWVRCAHCNRPSRSRFSSRLLTPNSAPLSPVRRSCPTAARR